MCGEMSWSTVNGMVLQMISLSSSSGTGTIAILFAIVVICILCVETGVYWRKREMAFGRDMIWARSLVDRLTASSMRRHCVHWTDVAVVVHGMPASYAPGPRAV